MFLCTRLPQLCWWEGMVHRLTEWQTLMFKDKRNITAHWGVTSFLHSSWLFLSLRPMTSVHNLHRNCLATWCSYMALEGMIYIWFQMICCNWVINHGFFYGTMIVKHSYCSYNAVCPVDLSRCWLKADSSDKSAIGYLSFMRTNCCSHSVWSRMCCVQHFVSLN